MPQGHNRHDMKWNSLQSKRLGLDSRVVDGGLLLGADEEQRATPERGHGTTTERPHGGISQNVDLKAALLVAEQRRKMVSGEVSSRADTSLIDRYDFPLSERFHFEQRDGKVVAFPAEMVEDTNEWCIATGCELRAERGCDGMCSFHAMSQEGDDISEYRIPLREGVNGREWDGFSPGMGNRPFQIVSPRVESKTGRRPLVRGRVNAYWRKRGNSRIYVSGGGQMVPAAQITSFIAAAPSAPKNALPPAPEGFDGADWTRFCLFTKAILAVPKQAIYDNARRVKAKVGRDVMISPEDVTNLIQSHV